MPYSWNNRSLWHSVLATSQLLSTTYSFSNCLNFKREFPIMLWTIWCSEKNLIALSQNAPSSPSTSVFFLHQTTQEGKKKFIGLSSVIQGFECGHLQEDDWSTKKSSQAILVLSKGFCGTKRLQWCALTLEVLYAAFKSGAWALEHITHCRARQKHTCHQQTPLQHLKRSLAVFTPAGVRRWLRDFCHMVKSLLHFWTLTYFFFCGYICFYSSSNNCKSTHKKCLEPSHLVAHCDRTTPTLLLQPMVHVIERQ